MDVTEIFSPMKKEDDSGQGFRFDKSLQELRDLRSQLHYAADYCKTTFLNTEDKKIVVETTKEYICKAVVTFVDHLGNVSANLNHSISQSDSLTEAELRINSLQQRLFSWEQFAHKLALTRVKWNPILPRHHRRYLSAPTMATVEKSYENPRVPVAASPAKLINKHELDADGVPLFLFTCTDKPSLSKSPPLKSYFDESDSDSTLVPVRDGLSLLSKGSSPAFHFQQGNKKLGRKGLYGKVFPSGDILAFFRRARRAAAR
ncbi:probable protein ABIL5 [Hibiscus syriacus]|uniref:probable protein ABIL5 n=1 Tax=Hibiscus syriacus TaxID=106335 RepID=UPI0019220153|nr:probable protein ABIL5 [Hibiscus syriacus]